MSERSSAAPIGWLIAVVLGFIAICLFIGSCSSVNRPGPTQVALIRNGGPFDSKSIREVRPPNSKWAISGLNSEVRMYIAGCEQRYYKVSSDPSLGSESGADFIRVPTRDGVQVEIDAQVLFHTGFTKPNCKTDQQSDETLESFDTQYGNREFRAKDGDSAKVWEGNDGWNAFLDTIMRPVVENAFREQVGSVNCSDLVSSCALVQSSSVKGEPVAFTGTENEQHFEEIQKSVQAKLEAGVKETLGGEYLQDFKVQLTKVTLPKQVQNAIEEAQASFAQISKARANKTKADYEAEANERLAAAYRNNPSLAYLRAIESLKDSNATIIVGEPGTGLNIGR